VRAAADVREVRRRAHALRTPPLPSADLTFVVNLDAGRCRAAGPTRVREIIRAVRPNRPIDIVITTAEALPEAIIRAAERGAPGVAVVGGDGTARTALQLLSDRGVPVLPLPGGSLNRLARAVSGATSLRRALTAAPAFEPFWLPGGRVGRRRFFVASGYGAAMRASAAREALRAGAPAAAWRALRAATARGLAADLVIGEREATAAFALASPGPLDAAFGLAPDAERTAIEIVAARPSNAIDLAAIAIGAVNGGSRRHPALSVARTLRVAVRGEGPVPALFDGEADLLPPSFELRFEARAGLALRPVGRDGRAVP
jgi:diacylglycerol kinase family enzyme